MKEIIPKSNLISTSSKEIEPKNSPSWQEKYNTLLINFKKIEQENQNLKNLNEAKRLEIERMDKQFIEDKRGLNETITIIKLETSKSYKKLADEFNCFKEIKAKIRNEFIIMNNKEKKRENIYSELIIILSKSNSYTIKDSVINTDEFEISEDSIINLSEDFRNSCICIICMGLLRKPQTCSECECAFCTKCINTHLSNFDNCPHCKQKFKQRNNKLLFNILDMLLIRCPLRCNESIPYRDVIKHMAMCKMRIKVFMCGLCENYLNAYGLNDSVIKAHNIFCHDRIENCLFCFSPVKRSYLGKHLEDCQKKLIKCGQCKHFYLAEYKFAHLNYYCEVAIFYKTIQELIEKL